jgi:hypothetical protein
MGAKKETPGNLLRLQPGAIDAIRATLRDEALVAAGGAYEITKRSNSPKQRHF